MTPAICSLARGLAFCSLAIPTALPLTGFTAPVEATVTCMSIDGKRHHCPGATDAGVALRQSVGSSNCLLGRNWGYDARGVWVTEGCGAVFALGNPAHEAERLAAQSDGSGPEDTVGTEESTVAGDASGSATSLGDYLVYTRFGAQMVTGNDEAEVQDARSRIGFRYSTGPDSRFFAAAEWSVNLTKNPSTLYPGESTSGGFVVLESDRGSVFGTRLGYVGLDFGERGKLTLGKQWGVHYDVTSYTDIFNVFGAEASATFNAGTDGGFMGTGRADEALSYRNSFFGRLKVGAQIQLRDITNGHGIDGFGASARFDILPGMEIGGTYTKVLYDETLKSQLLGLGGDAEYGAFGVRYRTEHLELAEDGGRTRTAARADRPGDYQVAVDLGIMAGVEVLDAGRHAGDIQGYPLGQGQVAQHGVLETVQADGGIIGDGEVHLGKIDGKALTFGPRPDGLRVVQDEFQVEHGNSTSRFLDPRPSIIRRTDRDRECRAGGSGPRDGSGSPRWPGT